MKVTVKFDADNSWFAEQSKSIGIASILRNCAEKVEANHIEGEPFEAKISDGNGNGIGTIKISK